MRPLLFCSALGAALLSGCANQSPDDSVPSPRPQDIAGAHKLSEMAKHRTPRAEVLKSPQMRNWEAYAATVRERVRPFIVFEDPDAIPGNPSAIVSLLLGPDGMVVTAKLTRSSGVPAWDRAVLAAVERASPLPVLTTPQERRFTITFRPKETGD
ncbi:energy transducer TonB [Cupriavidus malaysiensis]|uniref:energy transducer TonB n=1 Tax=Cupriavidus malaysiensis TaxID=367825 RepID=UPI000A029359